MLSFSRKGYSEVVWRQSSDAFIACLENAFHHFRGVPKRLVIDNLKAAVAQADWYDPEVRPKLQSFAAHERQRVSVGLAVQRFALHDGPLRRVLAPHDDVRRAVAT